MSDGRFGAHLNPGPGSPPVEILGFPTETALELGKALEGVGAISQRISVDGHVLGGMIGLFPLLERVQRGEEIQTDDVRPYRDDIKKIVHPLVDEFLPNNLLSRPLGSFGKIAIDTILEREFHKAVPFAAAKAREYVPRVEPYVRLMSGFDDPRQQFIDEVSVVNASVLEAIDETGEEPSALLTAQSLREVIFENLLKNPQTIADTLPIISGAMAIRNTRTRPVRKIPIPVMAAIASEILVMLSAPLPRNQRRPDIVRSVRRNPLAPTHLPYPLTPEGIEDFGNAAPVLLPSIRDLIPSSGKEVTRKFEEVKAFLGA